MRKIQELLRLKHEHHLPNREIAISLGVSAGTVSAYLSRAAKNNLTWPLPDEWQDEDKLYQLLFPPSEITKKKKAAEPDWGKVHEELKKHKHVTRFLLWYEYREANPNGFGYTRFCHHYREYQKQLDVTMRQTHHYGEKCFVDYAGMTVPWIERETGEVKQAELFVGVLGASNYTYIEATDSQHLRHWINSHCRMFEYFGGVPKILVPDNLKSGVTKAHHYDPDINPTYQELANHYHVAVIPTRVRAPKDKAKVEVGVQGVERRILAPLRHQQFFSIDEINEALKEKLEEYNRLPFQKLEGSRAELFLQSEKSTLQPLPPSRYQFAQWKKAKAGLDYHIAHEKHYYSVPFRYATKALTIRITSNLIECFYQQKKIATHRRAFKPGYTTCKEHMPANHQAYVDWTPERLIRWAEKIGAHTHALIQALINQHVIPQQAFRGCVGILRFSNKYGNERLNNACRRARAIGAIRYKNVESILKNGLDNCPLPEPAPNNHTTTLSHDNLRGEHYYQ